MDNSYGWVENLMFLDELLKKIMSFRDIMDLPHCNDSQPIRELLMITAEELHRLYPEVVPSVPISEMTEMSVCQGLAHFYNALKAVGDSWVKKHRYLAKFECKENGETEKNDSKEFGEKVLEKIDYMIKMAVELFDVMEEEEKRSDNIPSASRFEDISSGSYPSTDGSFCHSPVTPTSILLESIDSPVRSGKFTDFPYSPPLLLPLRIQSVEKLKPIDLHRLELHLFPHASDHGSNTVNKRSRTNEESEPEIQEETQSLDVPKNQKEVAVPKMDYSYGWAENLMFLDEIRKKIMSFRDIMDLPPCNGSQPIRELLMITAEELHKIYPEVVSSFPISEMNEMSPHKGLAHLYKSLKAVGDSWVKNHKCFTKFECKEIGEMEINSEEFGDKVLEKLDYMIKMTTELFVMMKQEEKKSDKSLRASKFRDIKSGSYPNTDRLFCLSPITPTSVLPKSSDSSVRSGEFADFPYSPPLLMPLRIQSVEKLKPTDLKHLAFLLFPYMPAHSSNTMNKSSRTTEESEPEIQEVKSNSMAKQAKKEKSEDCSAAYEAQQITMSSSNQISSNFGNNANRCKPPNIGGNPIYPLPVATNESQVHSPQAKPPVLLPKVPPIPPPPPPPVVKSKPNVSPLAVALPPQTQFTLLPNVLTLSPKFLQNVSPAAPAPAAPAPPPPLQPPPIPPIQSAPTESKPNVSPAAVVPPPQTQFTLLPNVSTPPSPPPPPKFLPNVSLAAASPPAPPPIPPPQSPVLPQNLSVPPPPVPTMLPNATTTCATTPPPLPTLPSKGSLPLPPPPLPLKNGAAPPPPSMGGTKALGPKKVNTKLKRSSLMGNLYREVKGKVEGNSTDGKLSHGRKTQIGGGGSGKQGMADALAEITKRSAYFQKIEEDVKKYEVTIMELKKAINSFETKDMAELIKFYQYVEHHLEDLTDETQVLARFKDFPTRKLETLRMGAILYTRLNAIVTTLENWKMVDSNGQLLDRVESYFNKIKVEVDALERNKDDEIKKFRSCNIHFDYGVLIRIKELMVDVSSSCMELALKERIETKAAANEENGSKTDARLKACIEMLWRTFQLAFRVYTFAGGQDDCADRLSKELAQEILILLG